MIPSMGRMANDEVLAPVSAMQAANMQIHVPRLGLAKYRSESAATRGTPANCRRALPSKARGNEFGPGPALVSPIKVMKAMVTKAPSVDPGTLPAKQ